MALSLIPEQLRYKVHQGLLERATFLIIHTRMKEVVHPAGVCAGKQEGLIMAKRFDELGNVIMEPGHADRFGRDKPAPIKRQFGEHQEDVALQAGAQQDLRDPDKHEVREHGPTSIGINQTNELPFQAGVRQNHTDNFPVRTIDRDKSHDPMKEMDGRKLEGGEYQPVPGQPGGGKVVPKGGVTVEEDHANGGYGVAPGGSYKTTRDNLPGVREGNTIVPSAFANRDSLGLDGVTKDGTPPSGTTTVQQLAIEFGGKKHKYGFVFTNEVAAKKFRAAMFSYYSLRVQQDRLLITVQEKI